MVQDLSTLGRDFLGVQVGTRRIGGGREPVAMANLGEIPSLEQIGSQRWPAPPAVNEGLPRQPVMQGIVRKDKIVEMGGVAHEKRWRINDECQNDVQQR